MDDKYQAVVSLLMDLIERETKANQTRLLVAMLEVKRAQLSVPAERKDAA